MEWSTPFRANLSSCRSHRVSLIHTGRLANTVPWCGVSLPDDVRNLASGCEDLMGRVVRHMADKAGQNAVRR